MDIKTFFKALAGLIVSLMTVAAIIKIASFLPEYSIFVYLLAWASVIIIAYSGANKFKESDGEDGMVIYTDYHDVFKCLSVAGVPAALYMIGLYFGQEKGALLFSSLYAATMTLHVCYLSAKMNKFSDLPVVFITKFSISIIWIISVIQILDPAGKNASQRRTNRATATMVLFFLTPLLNMFVLSDEGKERRFSGAGAIRNKLK